MTLGRRDVAATVLTALAVLTFFATREGWNVPLVGDSHRWAAGGILVLGIATCSLGTRSGGALTRILAVLGTVALMLAVVAIATGSLTVLSLLALAFVLLWAVSTAGHVQHGNRQPIAM
jgi:hypothetical protein